MFKLGDKELLAKASDKQIADAFRESLKEKEFSRNSEIMEKVAQRCVQLDKDFEVEVVTVEKTGPHDSEIFVKLVGAGTESVELRGEEFSNNHPYHHMVPGRKYHVRITESFSE